ncbi:MAG: hypothetical protein WCC94_03100 [Candidatus Bathyarchaeia archaeon]
MRGPSKTSVLKTVLILVVLTLSVLSVAPFVTEYPTQVYATVPANDFGIELSPASLSFSQGVTSTKTFSVSMTNNHATGCTGGACPNELLGLFTLETAYVSLAVSSDSPQVTAGFIVNFFPSYFEIPGGQSKTVQGSVNVASSVATGSYHFTIIASVSWPSLTGPTKYQAGLSVGVNIPPPLPPTSLPSQVNVGQTWSEMTIHFKDGSQQTLKSSQSVVAKRIALYQLARLPQSIDFYVKAVNVPQLPRPSYVRWDGTTHTAAGFILKVTTNVRILVNGMIVYTSPSNGVNMYWSQEDYGLIPELAGFKSFGWGQQAVQFSMTGWNADNYLSKSQSTTFEYYYTQDWSVYGVWTEVHLAIGAPSSTVCGGLTDCVDRMKPVWSAHINQEPITTTVPAEEVTVGKPFFKVGVSPLSATIGVSSGTVRTFQVQAQGFYGFNSEITFSTQNLPTGISGSWAKLKDTPTQANGWIASTQLTITTSSGAKLGAYNFDIVGSGGGLTSSVTVSLTVEQTAGPDETEGKITAYVHVSVDQSAYQPGARIKVTGSVSDYNGNGLPNVPVSLTSTFNFTQAVTTDSHGTFQASTDAPTTEGRYSVTASFAGDTSKYAGAEDTATFQVSAEAGSSLCSIPLLGAILCGNWQGLLDWLSANWILVVIVVVGLYVLYRVIRYFTRPKYQQFRRQYGSYR